MRRNRSLLTLLTLATLFSTLLAASAQTYTNPFDTRWWGGWNNNDFIQARLSQRIESGRASGRLTMSEYRSLKYTLNSIHRLERQLKSDGRLGPRERQLLSSRLNSLERQVRNEMNDRQVAGHRYPRWY